MSSGSVTEASGTVLQRTPRNLAVYAIYIVVVGLSAVFPFAAHTKHFVLPCVMYVMFILIPLGFCLFWLLSPLPRRILSHPMFWLLCLAPIAWYDESRFLRLILPYPDVNTAASALMFTARNMLHAINPYAVQLAGHAPVSPGPGWILLLAPITLAKGAGLLTCLGALLVSLVLVTYARVSVGVLLLLTLLQPELVMTSFWGTDLFLIPFAFATLCLLADRYYQSSTAMIILGCGAGILAQSRLPMAVLPFILAVGLWRKDRRTARWFILAAVLVAAVFYLSFYFWTVRDHLYFQPLHLLHRERRSGLWASIVGPLGGLLVLVWVLLRMTAHVRDWLLASATLLLLTFAPTGLGELAIRHNPGNWEGANYVCFGLSLFVTYLALGISKAPPRRQHLPTSSVQQLDEYS